MYAKLLDFEFLLFQVVLTCLKLFNVCQCLIGCAGCFLGLFAMFLVSSGLFGLVCGILYVVECVFG